MQNINILLFVCSLYLTSLKLCTVGLSTIKHQHSKKLTWWIEATWTKNAWKCKLFGRVCSQKVCKMSTICTHTCLEMLSSLVNCSVDNVLSEIGPLTYLAQLQSFKPVKDSEWTKRKMLIFCTLLIFAPTLWHLKDICWIDDKKWHLKHVLRARKVQTFWF